MIKNIILMLIAGVLGGLTNSLGIWLFGMIGINSALGFNMQPELTVPWIMPRLISSGLWGLLFLIPIWKSNLIKKGALLSIGPLLMMLFVVFPKMGAGMFGLKLGQTAPLFAVFFTLVWGITAGWFLKNTTR